MSSSRRSGSVPEARRDARAELDDRSRIYTALTKPLEFAARDNFAHLDRVKDLETTLARQCDALDTLGGDAQAFATKIRTAIDGIDACSPVDKRARIERMLALLTGKHASVSPTGSANKTRAVPPPSSDAPLGPLTQSITIVTGVGPRMAELVRPLGVETVEDALYYLPFRYEDWRNIIPITDAAEGMDVAVVGTILESSSYKTRPRGRAGKQICELVIEDDTGMITAKWFTWKMGPFEEVFPRGKIALLRGKVSAYQSELQMTHPEARVLEEDDQEAVQLKQIVPIYSTTAGLSRNMVRTTVHRVVDGAADAVPDCIPEDVGARRKLVPFAAAVTAVHKPPAASNLNELSNFATPAHRRLVFEELFVLQVGLAIRRRGVIRDPGTPCHAPTDDAPHLVRRLIDSLPFRLTGAQERVWAEIDNDLAGEHPMNRLLQGDVGSGKTLVALMACVRAAEAGHQAAIMAPTEILAEQHYATVSTFLENLPVRTAVLTGSLTADEKERTHAAIARGDIDLVVGTHALIQEAVRFQSLALAVIDEQHRFGVWQRAGIRSKGARPPHILVMTATPIPRTLALTLYGDLDVSIVDEMPKGREPVSTRVFRDDDREQVYRRIKRALAGGHQAYVVYPLVEESEKLDIKDATRMYEHLQFEVFDNARVGLVHGRMAHDERERTMRAFVAGDIDILVATTVIEVGVDVPNATVMVIEHAERFGLSQLHQLRGRVGRGTARSECLLIACGELTDVARKRLAIIEQTTDGFRIAEEDLAIRGPGEFLGARQSGMPDFRVANIVRDIAILEEARDAAFQVVERDPELADPAHAPLKAMVLHRWAGRLKLAGIA